MMTFAHAGDEETWLDRVGKWAPLLTLLFVVVGGGWAGIIAIEGGFQSGNQTAINDVKNQISTLQKHVETVEKAVEPIPRTLQIIDDHTHDISQLKSDSEKLRQQQSMDEREYDTAVAKIMTRLDGLTPDFRIPRNK